MTNLVIRFKELRIINFDKNIMNVEHFLEFIEKRNPDIKIDEFEFEKE